jgi:hypothetical protein
MNSLERTINGNEGWLRLSSVVASPRLRVGSHFSMIPKSGNRFSEKIMLNKELEQEGDSKKSNPALGATWLRGHHSKAPEDKGERNNSCWRCRIHHGLDHRLLKVAPACTARRQRYDRATGSPDGSNQEAGNRGKVGKDQKPERDP